MRIAAAWLFGAWLLAGFVAFTSIGPVVYSLGWRHGVHATDILVGLVVVASAGRYTLHRLGDPSGRSGRR